MESPTVTVCIQLSFLATLKFITIYMKIWCETEKSVKHRKAFCIKWNTDLVPANLLSWVCQVIGSQKLWCTFLFFYLIPNYETIIIWHFSTSERVGSEVCCLWPNVIYYTTYLTQNIFSLIFNINYRDFNRIKFESALYYHLQRSL